MTLIVGRWLGIVGVEKSGDLDRGVFWWGRCSSANQVDHEYVSFFVDWMMKFPHVADSVGGHMSRSCDICCVSVCTMFCLRRG